MTQPKKLIKVVSRDSALAMWQTNHVIDSLKAKTDAYEFEIVSLKTKGDKILDVSLAAIGDKGLFTQELEAALLDGSVDFAVHSMKDMPTNLPEGLQISSILERHDPRDVFISEKYENFAALPQGAVIGTSSLRRRSQLLHARPDLNIVDLRGNVNSRMRKMKEQNLDGIILAAAGVERMGWAEEIREKLDSSLCLSAVSQGAIGVETRSDNEEILALVALVNHEETAICVNAERAMLAALEGGCQIPIAAHATISDGIMTLEGVVGSINGDILIRDSVQGNAEDYDRLGKTLAGKLLEQGAADILAGIRTEN